MKQRKEIFWLIIEAVALLLFLAMHLQKVWALHLAWDDAYMYSRYIMMMGDGWGWTWNPGVGLPSTGPINGITSPLWLGLVGIVQAFMREGAILSGRPVALLSQMSALLYLAIIYLGMRYFLPKALKPLALLPLLWLHTNPIINIANHATSGMETCLAGVFISAYIFVLILEPKQRLLYILLIYIGWSTYLLRPESALLLVGAPAIIILQNFLSSRAQIVRSNTNCLILIGGIITGIIIYHIWHYMKFAHALPLPAYVKGLAINAEEYGVQGNTFEYFDRFMEYLTYGWPLHIALIAVLAVKRNWARFLWVWVPVTGIILYTGIIIAAMGYYARYQFPYVGPLLLLLAVAIGEIAANHSPSENLQKKLTAIGRGSLVGLTLYFGMMLIAVSWVPKWQMRNISVNSFEPPEKYELLRVLYKMPPMTSIAAEQVGVLGVYTSQCIIYDVVGLHDPEFAHGFSPDALFEREIDLVTLIPRNATALTASIKDHPEFKKFEPLYRGSSAPSPEHDLYHTIWINPDGPRYDAIMEMMRVEALIKPNPIPLF